MKYPKRLFCKTLQYLFFFVRLRISLQKKCKEKQPYKN